MGLPITEGELSRQSISASQYIIKGKRKAYKGSQGNHLMICITFHPFKAYVDLVRAWGWRSFTIIYETNEGLVRLQELLKAHGPSEFPITVRQLSDSGDYRPLLKQIKNSAEAHIVLDCNTDKIYDVLKQAQQIGMMSDYHSYLITSLDLYTVDLEEFKYGGTNITAFRLVDPDSLEVQQTIHNWTAGEAKLGKKVEFGIQVSCHIEYPFPL